MSQHDRAVKSESGARASPAPKLEVEDYRDHLVEFEFTAKEERELLETLWGIMQTMVDIGFGLDAVQQVIPAFVGSVSPSTEEITQAFNDNVSHDQKGAKL
ncbi:MAG: hypothetical protein NXH95_15960 [Pseudomonadaceae bacterium]|nr:hypothetical protein [Pseudomonadaceae bacterium]